VILIGIGGNLPSQFGDPRQTCEAALAALDRSGLTLVRRSRWYRTAPVPASDQPWYVNGVALVSGPADPFAVLRMLNAVETDFGRVRGARNAARVIDLDLLAHGDTILDTPDLHLPHPRMHQRAFVLLPLAEVAPRWRHPASARTVEDLIAALPPDQAVEVAE
jgi:2-amino-4-hydroxy-6-hydroxymethyldihydropteridine diphosphokinase